MPGIDDTIKVWAPTAPARQPVPPEAERVQERNRHMRGRGPDRELLPVSPELLRLLFGARARAAGRGGGGGGAEGGGEEGAGEESEEDEDEEGCRVS